MGFSIEHLGPGIVATIFEGEVEIGERFHALDALDEALGASNPKAVLIDLSKASVGHYGASDALKFANRINGKHRPLRRVAYVLRPYQADMLATVMSGLHGPETFRRFEDREAALAWLGQSGQRLQRT